MSRVLIVSNRLPITLRVDAEGASVTPSAGGLSTALRGPHQASEGLWIGWPGDTASATPEQKAQLDAELQERRLIPVELSASDIEHYYDIFSNAVLWPLLHYAVDKVKFDAEDSWQIYQAVNQRFADTIVRHLKPGDRVWIHDYQLMLVPEMVRRAAPGVRIGFFLHVPFPAADVFRILPWRAELLRGLLGADLLGFHTATYRTNFGRAVAHVLDIGLDVDMIPWADHNVRLGTFPIGIDNAAFNIETPGITTEIEALREGARGKKVVLGIDRLDYTKGIIRRLHTFDRLLTQDPDLRSRVQLTQIGVPSREAVDAYGDLRKQANELVGRINATHGTPAGVPVHFLYRSIPFDQLVALYRTADVMLVNPIRDGMNLVAKEYCAARNDEQGVLVLSEFAGAADELREALIVNPHDINGVARTLSAALAMPEHEQRIRMRHLRARVLANDVTHWVSSFLAELERVPEAPARVSLEPYRTLDAEIDRVRKAPSVLFLLDYDGTLVRYSRVADLAWADTALSSLIARLAARPGASVHIITGRSPASIEQLVGTLPVGLHAEHGYWSRADARSPWVVRVPGSLAWKEPFGKLLRDLAVRTPGALVEEKHSSMAFHYRGADPTIVALRLRELRAKFAETAPPDLEMLEGVQVLELRLRGVHKGVIAKTVMSEAPAGTVVFAAGDDRTDEDLFAALPEDAVTVRVGRVRTRARFRVEDSTALRAVLERLA